jgi:4-amino-4-deoxy-L-arabinose transferase-like glycosyltransferase
LGRRLLTLLLAIQLIRAVLYAVLLPLWQNPDELVHFEYVKLLADRETIRLDLPLGGTIAYRVVAALGGGGAEGAPARTHSDLRHEISESLVRHRFWEIRRLPDPDRVGVFGYSELNQPPLYYLVAAAVLRALSPGSIDEEAYALRFLSIIMSLVIVAIAYQVVRELLPDRPAVAFAAAGLITLIPQYTSLSGAITNDKLVEISFAGVFALTVRSARRGLSWLGWTGLAALTGMALLTKKSGWILVPILLFYWDLRRFRRGGGRWPRYALTRAGLFVAVAVLFLSAPAWLAPLAELYGRHKAALPPAVTAALDGFSQSFASQFGASPPEFIVGRVGNIDETPRWLRRYYFPILFRGFWGNFGYMEVPVSNGMYRVLMVAIGVAALGLVLLARGVARGRERLAPWQREVLVFLGGAAFWVFLSTFVRDALVFNLSQGRNLYPVVIPLALLFVLGLAQVARRAGDWRVCSALLAGMAIFDAVCIVHYVLPFFYGVTLLGLL